MSALPVPQLCAWSAKSGSPWKVSFPRRGAVPPSRRFFKTEEAANAEIATWAKGSASTALSKRLVDEVLYVSGLLPTGTSLTDLWRFYAQHHDGLVTATVRVVADGYLKSAEKKTEDRYFKEASRVVEQVVKELGGDTLFSAVPKRDLIRVIEDGSTYWNRYALKRAVRVLITQAMKLDAIKVDPLAGYDFEDAPKKTPHTLKLEWVEIILEYVARWHPELLASFVLKFFAGIRTEELCRSAEDGRRALSWDDIQLGTQIAVEIEVSKTSDRRVISFWPAALTNWLNACPGSRKGDVCPVENLEDAISRIIRDLNIERRAEKLPLVPYKQNDMRRTYASNTYALHGAKTADWTGHDLKVLKKHYKDFIPEADAKLFFESKPLSQHSNLLTLSA